MTLRGRVAKLQGMDRVVWPEDCRAGPAAVIRPADPVPHVPPCRVCGGAHVLVIEEVVTDVPGGGRVAGVPVDAAVGDG